MTHMPYPLINLSGFYAADFGEWTYRNQYVNQVMTHTQNTHKQTQ
jgi:hypothetical protein